METSWNMKGIRRGVKIHVFRSLSTNQILPTQAIASVLGTGILI